MMNMFKVNSRAGRWATAAAFFLLALLAAAVWAASLGGKQSEGQKATRHDASAPMDPVYKDIAVKTGGQVIDMRDPNQVRAFKRAMLKAKWQARIRRWRQHFEFSGGARFALYILLKLIAYSVWCGVGLLWRGGPHGFWRALGWGTLRMALGIGFGLTIGYFFLLTISFLNTM